MTGEYSGTEAQLVSFIEEMDSPTTSYSASFSGKTYTNSVAKGYRCQINNFTYVIDTSSTGRLVYTLELLYSKNDFES